MSNRNANIDWMLNVANLIEGGSIFSLAPHDKERLREIVAYCERLEAIRVTAATLIKQLDIDARLKHHERCECDICTTLGEMRAALTKAGAHNG